MLLKLHLILLVNPFVPNAPFFYPLKTSEHRKGTNGLIITRTHGKTVTHASIRNVKKMLNDDLSKRTKFGCQLRFHLFHILRETSLGIICAS